MVSQSQKIPSDYRTYENTSKIKKKNILVGLFESISEKIYSVKFSEIPWENYTIL